jgi:electron transport complex protein RnfB
MSDNVYYALRKFLDQFPRGFPETKSGIEIKILKSLFSKEEAKLTIQLSPLPEELNKIADRLDMEVHKLKEELDAMAKKGLIFRIQRNEVISYRAAPFMIGLYEYSINKINRELAALFEEYYETAYSEEMGSSNIPGFKVIPIERNIQATTVLLPYHKIEEGIRSARIIAVADCICRKETQLLGKGCKHPLETCLSFGAAAEFYIETGLGRQIRAEEALRILWETDQSGLVHAGANSKHLSNICNCCPCCCAAMKGITQRGREKHRHFNAIFEAAVNELECTGCETCLDRCPVGAITVEDSATVDPDKCLGCGLCASTCPTEAISMALREHGEEPYDGVIEMGKVMLKAKGKALLKVKQKAN